MSDLFGPASHGTMAVLGVAPDVALKATVLVATACAAHAALGQRRALARSALWNACLVGLILLPASSVMFPRLRLAVLAPAAEGAKSPATARVALPLSPSASSPFGDITHPELPRLALGPIGPAPDAPSPPVRRVEDLPGPKPVLSMSPAGLALGAYLAVAMLMVIRLGASLAAVARLRHACQRVDDPAWISGLDRWRARIGISGRVALLRSVRVSVPIVVGWLRPAVVVPNALVGSASAGVIDAVLVHELAHIRRGDFPWNMVRKLVQLVYWPHPLVWLVGRIVGAVREQACDDLCVHALGGADAYRASLLEVASGLVRRPGPALGLAMARRANLGRRLDWIDRTRGASRCLLGWPARLALLATVVPLAGVLGSIELARASARAGEQDDPPPKAAENAKGEPGSPPSAIEVIVVAKDSGKPLAGARVRPSIDLETITREADRTGRVRIDLSQRRFQDSLSLDVWAAGHVQQRFFFSQVDARLPKIPDRLTVELLPGEETLGGKVTDEEGRPIAGVKVEIWGYLGEKKEPHELCYMVDAVTDDLGQWRCRSFRSMTFAYLYLSHPDYLSDDSYHPRAHGRADPSNPPGPNNKPMTLLRNFTDVQVMARGVAVAGTAADREGKPVAGAEVGWLEATMVSVFHHDLATTTTDAQGRFHFPHVRPGRLALQVKAKGYAPALATIVAKEGAPPAEITLGPPRTLTGEIVDSLGKPIEGAFVNIDTWRGSRALGVYLKTDAQGRFRWDDAPPDMVLLNASRAGYSQANGQRVVPGEKDVLLTLRRTLAISGRVRDSSTNEPIDRAEVYVAVPDKNQGEPAWGPRPQSHVSRGRLHVQVDVERMPDFQLRVIAKGYEPFVSRTFHGDETPPESDIKLAKARRPPGLEVSGTVLRPDGEPLGDADVVLTYPWMMGRLPIAHIENGHLGTRSGMTLEIVKTDADGRFTLSREPDPEGMSYAVIVVHADYYAEVPRASFEVDPRIIAHHWGRIEGTAYVGHKPAAGAAIRCLADRLGNPVEPHVESSSRTMADERGRYVFERVVPGDVRVFAQESDGSNGQAWSNGTLVQILPGETVHADIGGKGRVVIAKIAPPEGFDPKADYGGYSEYSIESDRPRIPYPRDLLAARDGSLASWGKTWWASPEGHAYRRRWHSLAQRKLEPDGTIRAADVPPGEYVLRLTYTADSIRGVGAVPGRVAFATKQFVIPEGRDGEPFDLGVLHPKPKQSLKVGQAVPSFDVEALDGGRRPKLEDFRGKVLLLDFWAAWCGPCIAELPGLQAVHDRFGKNPRFAMLSLSLDAEKGAPRKLVAEKGLSWSQGFLGDWVEKGVQDAYHVEAIPMTFLIGPDGKLLAAGLRGEAMSPFVAQALGAGPVLSSEEEEPL